MPAKLIEEVREDILILNIVKLFERRSTYLFSRSPAAVLAYEPQLPP